MRTFIAFAPNGSNLTRPIATATSPMAARIAGAKWCNANLDTAGIPVTHTEIPLMEVDSLAHTLREIPATA